MKCCNCSKPIPDDDWVKLPSDIATVMPDGIPYGWGYDGPWNGKTKGTHYLCVPCKDSLLRDLRAEAVGDRAEALYYAGIDMTGQDQEAFLGWPRG